MIPKAPKPEATIFSRCLNICDFRQKRREPSILQLEPHIRYLISKQEEELAFGLSSTAYYGDINRLKLLINGGADPNTANYDGRTALVSNCFRLNNLNPHSLASVYSVVAYGCW